MAAAHEHSLRSRSVRDPIHGDIELSPLESAVVDTREFQRLRYIRQNGLLHFVFPGAVHTRFAHSLGAFSLAKRAFAQLVAPVTRNPTAQLQEHLVYLEKVFRLAVLLHDVGHCAFSHSIEQVRVDGEGVFGSVEKFFKTWDELALLEELVASSENAETERHSPTMHEHISLVLVRRIFRQSAIKKCTQDADQVAKDVNALIHGNLSSSNYFVDAVRDLIANLSKVGVADFDKDTEDLPRQVLLVLHQLVSGTLDVDRLDYLVRDSFHCGVPYGRCDVEFLLKNIRIGAVAGLPVLVLDAKARYALEDMLWSRYQLFVQVLNHKTNVALNAALQVAITDAIDDLRIERPNSEAKLLAFTDDYVMSNIHRVALAGGKLADKSYIKSLIDRRFPMHIGTLDMLGITDDVSGSIERKKEALAQEFHILAADITTGKAKSNIAKVGRGILLQSWNRHTNCYDEPIDWNYATIQGPLEHNLVHFFADRDKIQNTRERTMSHEKVDASES